MTPRAVGGSLAVIAKRAHPCRRPRVLWLTKGLGLGGSESLMLGAARLWDRERHEVEVAYVLPWKDALVNDFESCGLSVRCLGGGRGPGWVPRLRRLVRDGDFDLVHTHMPLPAVVARLSAAKEGPVLVHTEHNVWDRYRWLTCWSNAWTFHRNQRVLTVSESVAASIRSRSSRLPRPLPPLEVLLHGIDPRSARHGKAARSEGRRRMGLGDDDLVVGSVGNLTAKKDQQALLRALGVLVDDFPSVRLVLVGSGPLESKLRHHVGQAGLGERVLFTGIRHDVAELLPAFDVFALSSLHEGLPIALLEAMASALPSVVTSVGGIPEVVRDGVEAMLIPARDDDALVLALARLLGDPTLRSAMGTRARSRSADFELVHAVRRQQDVYDEVLGWE